MYYVPGSGVAGIAAARRAVPAPAEERMFSLLSQRISRHVASAYAISTDKTTQSALAAIGRCMAALPSRTFFIEPGGPWTQQQAEAHNEWSLMLCTEHMAMTPSLATGKPLASETIATYISLGRTHLETDFGFPLLGKARSARGRHVRHRMHALARAHVSPFRSTRYRTPAATNV